MQNGVTLCECWSFHWHVVTVNRSIIPSFFFFFLQNKALQTNFHFLCHRHPTVSEAHGEPQHTWIQSCALGAIQSFLFWIHFDFPGETWRSALSAALQGGGGTALTWLLQLVAPYPRRSISRTIRSHSCENCVGHMRGWTSIESALKRSAVTQTGRLCSALRGRTGTRWLERARRSQTDVCLSAWRGEKEQNIRRR